MEVSVRRMSDPSLGKRRLSNPLVGLDGGAQQLMIPLGEGELCERSLQAYFIL